MHEFWAYWYYNIPNYALAVLMYTLLGRLFLGFFVPEMWDNYIWRTFKAISNPVLSALRLITPALVEGSWLLLCGVIWIVAIRVAFTLAMASAGLTPPVVAAG